MRGKYYTVQDACQDLRICRNTLMKLAERADAIRRIGRRVLIDMDAIDEHLKSQSREV